MSENALVLSSPPAWAVSAEVSDNFAGGITLGFPRIAIKGSRWRIRQGENETVLNDFHIDVVLLDANPNVSKSYYAKAYAPDSAEAPDCASDDGITPNVGVTSPQAMNCATCPHNVWGSKLTPSGKQAKACADQKHLAVLGATSLDGEIYALTLPPASLKGLALYVNTLNGKHVDVRAAVTRLTFDSSSDFPLIQFAPVRWLQQHEYETVLARMSDPVLPSVIATVPRAHRPAPAVAAPAAPVQQPTPAPAPAAPAAPAFQAAPVPQPAPAPAAPAPSAASPFGGAQVVTPAPVAQASVTPVSSGKVNPTPALQESEPAGGDAGVPEDTLARVKAMLAAQGLKFGG